jgi:carboxypeptidase family protein/TonB-dependent receptor-like protein
MKLSYFTRLLTIVLAVLLTQPSSFAQSGRGTITGVVKDSSGALVPKAELVITNKATGVETKSATTEGGLYRVPYVEPGIYRATAALQGFKTAVRDNVEVGVAQTVTLDFTLEVGEVTDQVTVSAETPVLESSTSEIGINSTLKEVHTWPILVEDGTRQLQSFIFRAMPGTQGNEFAGTINGSQAYSHEILIDGISLGRMDLNGGSNNEFTPTIDAVSEFKLQTGALSSQYGNTQTALVNFGLKSGTNDYHGSGFFIFQNKNLNANTWENNRFGVAKSAADLKNFGATVGGPVVKNKTHFYFSYEGNRLRDFRTGGTNDLVPARFKSGDFSQLLDPAFTGDSQSGKVVGKDALGRDVVFGQLYDPRTSRQLADGTWIRDPFAGNIIPQSAFSKVSQNVLKHAQPNPLLNQLRRNNPRVGTCCPVLNIDNWSTKIDHVFNDRHKASGSYVSNDRYRYRYGGGGTPQIPGDIPGPAANGDKIQSTPGWLVRLAEDWTISPTKLNHLAFGYNRFRNKNVSNSFNAFLAGTDWKSELGLTGGVGGGAFIIANFTGNSPTLGGSLARWGHQGTGNNPNGSAIVQDDFTWLHRSHSFRFGGEHRRYYLNENSVLTSGNYTFHNENTAQPGFETSSGFSFASLLLGAVRNSSLGIPNLSFGERSRITSFYLQDDWKVSSKLTLNLGIRWDIPEPISEAASRMSGLDPNLPNPGANGFKGAFVVLGDGPGRNGKKNFTDVYYKEFGPRVGFAYAASSKMVIRGGYGINYSPPLADGFDYPYTSGFDGSNPINPRTGRFRQDPSFNWDSPYPQYSKVLPNTDPTLLNNDDIGFYRPETNKFPRIQNWNLGIQYELPWETKLEVNYIGNKSIRLKDNYLYSLNQVDPKYLSLGDTLLDDISDHPEIRLPYASFEGTVAQSLRPFPQYRAITTHRLNDGYSNYHSAQMTVIKRSSHGLSFITAYTFSKALGNADSGIGYGGGYGQNFFNRKADYSVTSFHTPHDLKVTWLYDLPFGPGARWQKTGVLSRVIGGWTVSAIQRYRSGNPLAIGAGSFEGEALFNPGLYAEVLLPRDQQVIGSKPNNPDPDAGTPYLNPKAFGDLPKTSSNIPLRLGNAPRYLPNLRGFAQFGEDLSLIKKTDLKFREGAFFELRIDATNILNRIGIADPNTDVTDPDSFGRVFGKAGSPRVIQFGARLIF